MSTTYTRTENDIFAAIDGASPVKVASIDEEGALVMARGKKAHLEAVEAFLSDSGDKLEVDTPLAEVKENDPELFSCNMVFGSDQEAIARIYARRHDGDLSTNDAGDIVVTNSFETEAECREFGAKMNEYAAEAAAKVRPSAPVSGTAPQRYLPQIPSDPLASLGVVLDRERFKAEIEIDLPAMAGKDIPPCPEEGSGGDKTPSVIKWFFTHMPTVAAKKYHNRKFTMPRL